MKALPFLLIFNFLCLLATAQRDSTALHQAREIQTLRLHLLEHFRNEDSYSVALSMDSLAELDDSLFCALRWDERWMLHIWGQHYGNLLAEVADFDAQVHMEAYRKRYPARDSLFVVVDSTVHAQRFQVFQSMQTAFLNTEEKALLTLLMESLLRLPREEADWAMRTHNFYRQFPDSKYLPYLRYMQPELEFALEKTAAAPRTTPRQWGGGIDFLLAQNSWHGRANRIFDAHYGLDLGISCWRKRWNALLRIPVSWAKLSEPVYTPNFDREWPEGAISSLFTPSLELGYDVVNQRKWRFIPTLGFGFGILKPRDIEDDEGNSVVEYPGFENSSWLLTAALNFDIRLHSLGQNDFLEKPAVGYGGLRVRAGYRWLDFGQQNPVFQGNMFFFALGYSLFAR